MRTALGLSPADTPTETVIPADLQYPRQDLIAFAGPALVAGDAQSAVLWYQDGSGTHLALLDLATAHISTVFGTLPAQTAFSVILTAKYIAWYATRASMPVLYLLTRAARGAAETTLQVPAAPVSGVFPPRPRRACASASSATPCCSTTA